MAAPFWRSRPGTLPIDPRAAVVTVCVMLMRDNLESSDMVRNRNLVTSGHQWSVTASQRQAKQRRQARRGPGDW
jgi:hypothetical protein